VDSSSTKLAREALEGKQVEVEIVFTSGLKPGEMMYMKLTLSGTLISSYQTSGSARSDDVIETFTLNFADVKFETFGNAEGDSAEGISVYDLGGS